MWFSLIGALGIDMLYWIRFCLINLFNLCDFGILPFWTFIMSMTISSHPSERWVLRVVRDHIAVKLYCVVMTTQMSSVSNLYITIMYHVTFWHLATEAGKPHWGYFSCFFQLKKIKFGMNITCYTTMFYQHVTTLRWPWGHMKKWNYTLLFHHVSHVRGLNIPWRKDYQVWLSILFIFWRYRLKQ